MVIVKTILGSFDTSTKSFLKEPKKQISPIEEKFKSFKLLAPPPTLKSIVRFGGQSFQELKRAPSLGRSGVRGRENDKPRQVRTFRADRGDRIDRGVIRNSAGAIIRRKRR